MKIGILTIADQVHHEPGQGPSGPAIQEMLTDCILTEWGAVTRLVPNDTERIEATLIELSDHELCSLILTLGGAGPCDRDIIPEVTECVCDRLLPGFGEEMRRSSFKSTPSGILSRQTAGIRGSSLLINLSGSPASAEQQLRAILHAIPACLETLHAPSCTLRSE